MRRRLGTILSGGILGLLLSACRCGEAARPAAMPPTGAAPILPQGRTLVLATLPVDGPRQPLSAAPAGLGLHVKPSHQVEYHFGARGRGVAWAVEGPGGFQVIWNGQAGKTYAAIGTIAVSPDGLRHAHGALVDGAWRMVVDGQEGSPFAAVQAPVFSPDSAHLAYQAMAGDRWHLVVDGLVNDGTSARYLGQEFSADGDRLAFITDVDDEGRGALVVSDLAFTSEVVIHKGVARLAVNSDRTRLLAAHGGGEGWVAAEFDAPSRIRHGPGQDEVSSAAFGSDGTVVMQVASRQGRRFLSVGEEEFPLPPGDPVGTPVGRPGRPGAGILLSSQRGVVLHEVGPGAGQGHRTYDEAEGLVYSRDGATSAYAARRGAHWFIVVGGREGPPKDRVVTPAFSADGRAVVYRARRSGARFVVVAGLDGATVREHPPYEQVFAVQFTPDGRSLTYGVKDGPRLAWKEEPL